MKKYCIILLLFISISSFAQDKLVVFQKNGINTETLTSSIDSVTFSNETTMHIHTWNGSITDIPLSEIDSIKMIPDQGTANTDRDALIAFYNATGGPNWMNKTNWCSEKPLNEWYGVNTDSNGRVSIISLASNQLAGSIPAVIGKLSKLIKFDIPVNQVTGSIPIEFGQLSNLQQVSLGANLLTGIIPSELGKLSKLEFLYLFNNQLSGTIPPELGKLSQLVNIKLSENQLSGTIPAELGKLSNLEVLGANANNLTGTIPSELGKLAKLKSLHLWRCNLTGTIPPELGKLSNLDWLHLADNQLTGTIPSELGQLEKLRFLDIENNQLTGVIPTSLGQLTNLGTLDLSENQLTGTIPAELKNLNNLKNLSLSINKLSGNIPSELGQLTNLNHLNLNGNQFEGSFPVEFKNLVNLTFLCVSSNSLSGTIPPELGQLSSLKDLRLNSNYITGSIPPELGQLSTLEYLDLSCNQLADSIPVELGQLMNLKNLDLSFNHYIGEIPREVAVLYSLPNLSKFNITNNRFSGIIPTSLINHPNWNELVWGIVKQQPGYTFDREIVKTVDANVTDIDNRIIDLDSLFASNKFTVVFKWSDWDPYTGKLLPILKSIYESYSGKGLGIISFTRSYNDDINSLKNIIRDNQMAWTNVIFTNSTDRLANFPNYTVPNVHIVDKEGEVVFSDVLWDKREDFEKFITSHLGPIELYQSNDFSQDGNITKLQGATIGKGLKIVLMGDGFVDTTLVAGGLYEQTMNEAMEHFFSVEPTKSYREYFDVYAVKAVSKNGVFMDRSETIFSSKFGESRGISGDIDKIKEYAQKVDGINDCETHILTILNSTGHAGICFMYDDGSVSFISMPSDTESFAGVLQHEVIGHGLGKLGDEYIDYYETIKQADRDYLIEAQSKGWFQNISLSPENPPWVHFIGNFNYTMVGAFEGGFYYWKGVWRPEETSSMIVSKLHYFNGPSREQIVKRTLLAAGVTYTWEDFVAKDENGSVTKAAIIPTVNREEELGQHSPPVIMNKKLFE